jgi:hypothetical protein
VERRWDRSPLAQQILFDSIVSKLNGLSVLVNYNKISTRSSKPMEVVRDFRCVELVVVHCECDGFPDFVNLQRSPGANNPSEHSSHVFLPFNTIDPV